MRILENSKNLAQKGTEIHYYVTDGYVVHCGSLFIDDNNMSCEHENSLLETTPSQIRFNVCVYVVHNLLV